MDFLRVLEVRVGGRTRHDEGMVGQRAVQAGSPTLGRTDDDVGTDVLKEPLERRIEHTATHSDRRPAGEGSYPDVPWVAGTSPAMTRRDVSQRRGRFVQACALSWLTWLPEEGAKHISELSRDRVLSLFLAETPHPARSTCRPPRPFGGGGNDCSK